MLFLATKLIKKPDSSNAKEYYISFLKNKNKKLIKQSKIIMQQPRTIESQNIFDIKSVTKEHLKTFPNLSRTIKQAKKVSQVGGTGKSSSSCSCSETAKNFDETKTKNAKKMKQSHVDRRYASTCNVQIWNFFNVEHLLIELKGF